MSEEKYDVEFYEPTSDQTITTEKDKDSEEETNDDDKDVDEVRNGQELHKETSKEDKTPGEREGDDDHNKVKETPEIETPGRYTEETNGRDGTTKVDEDSEDENSKKGAITKKEETTKGDDQAVLHFNLLNPEILSKQLEVADIDDEQTEELLVNAQKINSQLKKILRRQQLNDLDQPPPLRKSAPRLSPSRKQREVKTSPPLPGGDRSASPKRTVGGRGPVPSAGRRKGCDREMTSLPQIHNTESGHDRAKSGKSRKGSAKSRATSSRSGTRPEWNDRFIYS